MTIWQRRLATGLVVTGALLLEVPALQAPTPGGVEAQAMTTLRALNAAQLVYSTSVGQGRYAATFEELDNAKTSAEILAGPLVRLSLRRSYRMELLSSGDQYTAFATPLPNRPRGTQGHRSFCVSSSGSIYWALAAVSPAVEPGQCPEGWKPIQ